MAIRIPGLSIDQSAADTGVSPLVQPVSPLSALAENVDLMGQIKQRKEQRDADAFSSKAGTELLLESQELLNQVTLETEDPNKITETFIEKYNELSASKAEGAPNAFARRQMEEKSNQLRATLGRAAIGIQADEVQAQRIDGLTDTLQKINNTVRTTGNLALGEVALQEALQGAESYTRTSELEDIREKAVNGMKTAHLDRLFEQGNMTEVRRLINDGDFNQDITTKQVDFYRKAIKKYQEEQVKLKRTNPIKAGYTPDLQLKDGIPLNQVVVLENEEAKLMVQEMSSANNPEEMTTIAKRVREKYGQGFMPNVASDLARAKLPGQYQAAFQMLTDPEGDTKYSQELGLLFESMTLGEAELKEQATLILKGEETLGFGSTVSDFKDQWSESVAGDILLLAGEGLDTSMVRKQSENIAMAHLAKTGNIDESIAIGTGWIMEGYEKIVINGVEARVPVEDVGQGSYNREKVQAGMDLIMAEDAIDILAPAYATGAIAENIKDLARPVLNDAGDGINMLGPRGEVLANKRGGVFNITFEAAEKATEIHATRQGLATSANTMKDIDDAFRAEDIGQLQLIIESLEQEGGGKRKSAIGIAKDRMNKLENR